MFDALSLRALRGAVSLAVLAASALAAGCAAAAADADDDLAVDESEAALHARPGRGVLGLRFRGLEPLGPDYVYEGWLIVNGEPVSAGRFELSSPGAAIYFTGPRSLLRSATAYVLTIEPKVGDDPAPSKVHVLAGDIHRSYGRGYASLTIGHPSALGTDFATATGGYILQTPTTASVAGDYRQGIWFVDPAAGAPSLSLPALPDGWVYEGWVVSGGTPVSTGRFKVPAGADGDGAGPTAGPDGSPPFPGQDFIAPPMDLVGGKVVISVEPEPDDMPAPFAIKPLVDEETTDVGPGVLQPLANAARTNAPRGVAVLF